MIVEQLIFIILAFALFVYMFYQLIKKNDTKYVPILAIQALGIAIDFIQLYFTKEDLNLLVKIIIYTLSILTPIIILIFEKLNVNITELVSSTLARIYLILGNKKSAKNILIKLRIFSMFLFSVQAINSRFLPFCVFLPHTGWQR